MNDIFDRLHADLITCRLRPGEALREKDLCQRYGVSRTPLREALVALAGCGLVKLSPNKGAYASPVDQSVLFSIYEVRIPPRKGSRRPGGASGQRRSPRPTGGRRRGSLRLCRGE